MKLSISNIAWQAKNDEVVYELMRKYGFAGLEIAPTRIFPESPYDQWEEASKWSTRLKETYNFVIPSMQSIWFGREEKLFGSDEEREILLNYTRKAVDFAKAIGCKNLVFGCPKNRTVPDGANLETAVTFFKKIGDYAAANETVIGMEANPTIYNTNYINDTKAALELIEAVGSKGFLLNLDVGTMVQNEEDINELKGKVALINHVHISEPGLKPVQQRELHEELQNILKLEQYTGFISIEMARVDYLQDIEKAMEYVKGKFN